MNIFRIITSILLLYGITETEIHAKEEINIITGSPLGTYVQIGKDIKSVCKKANIAILNSPGSMQNAGRLLEEPDKIHFGLIQLDVLQVLKRTNPNVRVDDIQIIMPLYYEEVHLVASVKSGIDELADLAGKKVNIGPETSGTRITSIIIKLLYEIEWKESNLSMEEALNQLLLNQIDAFFYVIGKPVPIFSELGEMYAGKIKLVDIKNDALEEYYLPAIIPAKTYPWQKETVITFKVPSVLAANKGVAKGKVKKLLRCIKKKFPYLKKHRHKKWREIDYSDFSNIKWPVHPVAKKMLK